MGGGGGTGLIGSSFTVNRALTRQCCAFATHKKYTQTRGSFGFVYKAYTKRIRASDVTTYRRIKSIFYDGNPVMN